MSDAPSRNPSIDESVTYWYEQLKGGNPEAARPLWNAYFGRLVALVRARLQNGPVPKGQEEDVALSAFHSFCVGAAGGRFPRLTDRDDLWRMLFVITTRKAIGVVRKETALVNGGGRVGSLEAEASGSSGGYFVTAREPTPEQVAEVTEQCTRLLGLLGSRGLREVAVWKMEGYSNADIAEKLGRSIPAVERKLASIRAIWARERKGHR
jgi:DNA-directed RNA polymerase specialized sigma24 family protein